MSPADVPDPAGAAEPADDDPERPDPQDEFGIPGVIQVNSPPPPGTLDRLLAPVKRLLRRSR